MKAWSISGDGRPWSVELSVRDYGGHLDFSKRARGGEGVFRQSGSVMPLTKVAAVGALPLGVMAAARAWSGAKCLPAGFHAEASCVSVSALSAFLSAYCWCGLVS